MIAERDVFPQLLRRVPLWFKGWLVGVSIGFLVLGFAYGLFRLAYSDRVMPGVMVGPIQAGGMNSSQLRLAVNKAVAEFTLQTGDVVFANEEEEWRLPISTIDLSYDVDSIVNTAMGAGRKGTVWQQLGDSARIVRQGVRVPLLFSYDQDQIKIFVTSIAEVVDEPVVPPTLEVDRGASGSRRVEVHEGSSGLKVDGDFSQILISSALAQLSTPSFSLPTKRLAEEYTDEQLETARARAERLLGKTLEVGVVDSKQTWILTEDDLIGFVAFANDFDEEKVAAYIGEVAVGVDHQPQNALFQFDQNLKKVTVFKPGVPGLMVNQALSTDQLISGLRLLEGDQSTFRVELVTVQTPPQVGTDDVNDLGIVTLLGKGESAFAGSIPSRVHNVTLTATKINGVLVAPGETFSFNAAVGEISAATGFQQAYVISQGRTVLGDGGGVCQDSTTLFRAVLNAGLPVVERRGHSYRVGYYEQDSKPGYDATVYSPTTDFQFKNDTPAHLLIQARVQGTKLTVELYGTSDGRVSAITNYALWDVTPPPPDLYQDDPTLPAGVIKQVDWKAGGAKTKFDYTVTRNGETIFTKTFYTTYKPWQAVFLKGTGV